MGRPPRHTPADPSLGRLDRATTASSGVSGAAGGVTATGTTVIGRDDRGTTPVDHSAIDAALREALRTDLALPPPLMLLPMRIEYRVVDMQVPVRVSDAVASLFKNDADVELSKTDDPVAVRLRANVGSRTGPAGAAKWSLDPSRLILKSRQEIWFRWFPDDSFTLRGVPPATDAETAALQRFSAASVGKTWTAIDDPAVLSAWQALSREIAPERALFFLRNPAGGDPNHLAALGTMTMLPAQIVLFALDSSGAVSELGRGAAIDPALRYTMRGLAADGWLANFSAALQAGMGLRLAAKTAVDAALAADWIIAIGLSPGDGAVQLKNLIEDRVANGEFAFLPQDSATNNAPGQPSPYKTPRADLGAFLAEAAAVEGGVLSSPLTQSAEIFAEAAGLDVETVARAPGSADLAYENARAMLRVVGPALIDTAVERTAAIAAIDEEEVVDVFADAMMARGPLPPVRFGKNPFGVLPVTALAGLTPLASDGDHVNRIEGFIRDFAAVIVDQSQPAADALVPLIEPGDPQAADKLDAILKLNPVSRRIEVSTVGQSDARALGCAYVTSAAHPVADYLSELQRRSIGALADPVASDTGWPLLYRLARLSLTKSTVFLAIKADPAFSNLKLNLRAQTTTGVEQEALNNVFTKIAPLSLGAVATRRPPGFSDVVGARLQRTSAQVLAGLKRLQEIAAEPDGVAKLEMLLMETIDLFQHRMDAWATGLAYRRLAKRRRAGLKGLAGGAWGMLGKLRPASATGSTDGFIQAPSMDQAVTAAVLRSAYLRHGGAFAIGLDSASVRQGLDLLDLLQAGISPGEALGYLGERLLHERKQDALISRLRDLFPILDPRDSSSLEIRLFDGLRLLGANVATLVSASEVAPVVALQRTLADHFDTLADIVMAEAAHLRVQGQADAANAWLQVLSGETIPGLPSVLRTRRSGHGSSHRIAVLLAPAAPSGNDTPRAIAEPSLAALAAERLGVFGQAVVRLTVHDPSGGAAFERDYKLEGDLGLKPIDLLVGGESEVILRARHRLARDWRDDAAMRAQVGPLPEHDIVSYMNRDRPVTIDLGAGPVPPAPLLAKATDLRRVSSQGRLLEPGDLSAAADPAKPLGDSAERDLVLASAAALADRAKPLAARITVDLGALRNAMGAAIAAARELQRRRDQGADAAQIALLVAGLETLHSTLDTALLAVSRYGEPGALRFTTTTEIADDPDDLERSLTALAAKLQDKAARLTAALPPAVPPGNAVSAHALRNGLMAALRGALDGDALRILPPFPRSPETTPLLAAATTVSAALDEWRQARGRVRRTIELFDQAPWKAYPNNDAATGADDPEADPRADEGVAPRARLFCNLVAARNPATAASFAGFVADEWAERRPSRLQQTGLSINYDSPQSEAPQALLLCEPSGPGMGAWSPAAAAGMVAETIRLMKMRALSAQQRPLSGPLFRAANQIPFLFARGAPPRPRIPAQQYRFIGALNAFSVDATFLSAAAGANVGIAGAGFNEIGGFGKVKE